MVQAKQGDSFVGEFGVDIDIGHYVKCSDDHPKAAVTHMDSDDKTKVKLTWSGPENVDFNSVKFPFTVVQDFETFWRHQ